MDKSVIRRLTLQKAQLEAFIDLVTKGDEDDDPLTQDDADLISQQLRILLDMQKDNAKALKKQLKKID